MTAMSEAFEHPQMCRGVSFVRVVLAFSFFWAFFSFKRGVRRVSFYCVALGY